MHGRGGGIAQRLAACWLTIATGCAHRDAEPAARSPSGEPVEIGASARAWELRTEVQRGYATWYGASLAGHRTASGQPFDPRRMTAAHRTLPLGTWVDVTALSNGRRVRVQITDRGPFGHAERIIDLSRAAADRLGIRAVGVAAVEVRIVSGP